jgi:hypothetical protein
VSDPITCRPSVVGCTGRLGPNFALPLLSPFVTSPNLSRHLDIGLPSRVAPIRRVFLRKFVKPETELIELSDQNKRYIDRYSMIQTNSRWKAKPDPYNGPRDKRRGYEIQMLAGMPQREGQFRRKEGSACTDV